MASWMASRMAWPKKLRHYDHLDLREETYHLKDISYYDALPNSSTALDSQHSLQKAEPVLNTASSSSSSSTSSHLAWQSGRFDKLLLVAAGILPLLVSASQLVTSVRHIRSTGPLLSIVSNNRATAQIIVSLISAILAGLNVYTVTKLLNLATRIHLLRKSLRLDTIKLIEAVVTRRWVADLPMTMLITSMAMVLLFTIPNVLWVGTLTPVFTNATILECGALKVPQYSTNSSTTWSENYRQWHADCSIVATEKGIFSNCPAGTLQSSLFSRVAQATSNLTQVHSKYDNSHYSYVGRSYGVGSPAGLVDDHLYGGYNSSNLLFYNYTEPGYLAHVTCFHNASSDWHLEEIQTGKPDNGIPYIYYARGSFPNAPPDEIPPFFSVVGLGGSDSIAAMAAKRSNGLNVILITAGSYYPLLNGAQCEVSLAPTMFTVGVDVVSKLISVLPVKTTTADSSSPLFDPTGGIADTVIGQLNAVGTIQTSLYTSVVGDALMSNINSTTLSEEPSPAAFAAMADSFSAMLDDILLFVGSSQFFIPNTGDGDFSTVDAHLIVKAVQLGEAKYVVATFVMCALLLAAVAVEAGRTRAWKWLPQWDFSDMTCLVLASAVAGEDIVGEIGRGRGGMQMDWAGSGSGGLGGDRGRRAPEGKVSSGHQEVSGVRLRLGRKVVRVAPAQEAQTADEDWDVHVKGDGDANGEQEVQLAAVSLRTSGAKSVAPLM